MAMSPFARDRQSGGVGLGLAIAERVAYAHQGSIRAANRTGGGLEVALNLKCACAGVIAGPS